QQPDETSNSFVLPWRKLCVSAGVFDPETLRIELHIWMCRRATTTLVLVTGYINLSHCLTALLLSCQLKRKKPARQKEEDFHHNVYVVLLSDAVAKHGSILRLNPKRDPLKPCVYVGMTGIPVDHRFENHKSGYKSAWVVRKYGL